MGKPKTNVTPDGTVFKEHDVLAGNKMTAETASSAPGGEIFKREAIAFEMKIDGKVNGKNFIIHGKGEGDARIGKLKGKWRCTSGDLPMAWGVLAPTFAYGMKLYAQYPDHCIQWFQSTMPQGYNQRRVTRFGTMSGRNNDSNDDEGTMNTYHVIRFGEGIVDKQLVWMVHNRVKLEATFREGSPLLKGDSCGIYLQSVERFIPWQDGTKQYVQYFYPIKGTDDIIISTQMTHNRPHCTHCTHPLQNNHNQHKCEHRAPLPLPPQHFKRAESKQWKDPEDPSDHICQDEINQYFHFQAGGLWDKIGQ
jgi:hypothetical protein